MNLPAIDGLFAYSLVTNANNTEDFSIGDDVLTIYPQLANSIYDPDLHIWPSRDFMENYGIMYLDPWQEITQQEPRGQYFNGSRNRYDYGFRNSIVEHQVRLGRQFKEGLMQYWNNNAPALTGIITNDNKFTLTGSVDIARKMPVLVSKIIKVYEPQPIFLEHMTVNRESPLHNYWVLNLRLPTEIPNYDFPQQNQQYTDEQQENVQGSPRESEMSGVARQFDTNVAIQQNETMAIQSIQQQPAAQNNQSEPIRTPCFIQETDNQVSISKDFAKKVNYTYIYDDDQYEQIQPIFNNSFSRESDDLYIENQLLRPFQGQYNYVAYAIFMGEKFTKKKFQTGQNLQRDNIILFGGNDILHINVLAFKNEETLARLYRLLSQTLLICWEPNLTSSDSTLWQINQRNLNDIISNRMEENNKTVDFSVPQQFTNWFCGTLGKQEIPHMDLRSIISLKQIINRGFARNLRRQTVYDAETIWGSYFIKDPSEQYPIKKQFRHLHGSVSLFQANLMNQHKNYRNVDQGDKLMRQFEQAGYNQAIINNTIQIYEYWLDAWALEPNRRRGPEPVQPKAEYFMSAIVQELYNMQSLVRTNDSLQNLIYYSALYHQPLMSKPLNVKNVGTLDDHTVIQGGGVFRAGRELRGSSNATTTYDRFNNRPMYHSRNYPNGLQRFIRIYKQRNSGPRDLFWNDQARHFRKMQDARMLSIFDVNGRQIHRDRFHAFLSERNYDLLLPQQRQVAYCPSNVRSTDELYDSLKVYNLAQVMESDVPIAQKAVRLDQMWLCHQDSIEAARFSIQRYIQQIMANVQSGTLYFSGFEIFDGYEVIRNTTQEIFQTTQTVTVKSIKQRPASTRLQTPQELVNTLDREFLIVRDRSVSRYAQVEEESGQFSTSLYEYCLACTQMQVIPSIIRNQDYYSSSGHNLLDRQILRDIMTSLAPPSATTTIQKVLTPQDIVHHFPSLYTFLWEDIAVQTFEKIQTLNKMLCLTACFDGDMYQNMRENIRVNLGYQLPKYKALLDTVIERKSRFYEVNSNRWLSRENYVILELVFMFAFHTVCTFGHCGTFTVQQVAQNPFMLHWLVELRNYFNENGENVNDEIQTLESVADVICFKKDPMDNNTTNHYNRVWLWNDMLEKQDFFLKVSHLGPIETFNEMYTVAQVESIVNANADLYSIIFGALCFITSQQFANKLANFKNTYTSWEGRTKQRFTEQKLREDPQYIFQYRDFSQQYYMQTILKRTNRAELMLALMSRFQHLLSYLVEGAGRMNFVEQKNNWLAENLMDAHVHYEHTVGKVYFPYPSFFPVNRWATFDKPNKSKALSGKNKNADQRPRKAPRTEQNIDWDESPFNQNFRGGASTYRRDRGTSNYGNNNVGTSQPGRSTSNYGNNNVGTSRPGRNTSIQGNRNRHRGNSRPGRSTQNLQTIGDDIWDGQQFDNIGSFKDWNETSTDWDVAPQGHQALRINDPNQNNILGSWGTENVQQVNSMEEQNIDQSDNQNDANQDEWGQLPDVLDKK